MRKQRNGRSSRCCTPSRCFSIRQVTGACHAVRIVQRPLPVTIIRGVLAGSLWFSHRMVAQPVARILTGRRRGVFHAVEPPASGSTGCRIRMPASRARGREGRVKRVILASGRLRGTGIEGRTVRMSAMDSYSGHPTGNRAPSESGFDASRFEPGIGSCVFHSTGAVRRDGIS